MCSCLVFGGAENILRCRFRDSEVQRYRSKEVQRSRGTSRSFKFSVRGIQRTENILREKRIVFGEAGVFNKVTSFTMLYLGFL